MESFKEGQELEFNVYGNKIKGKFLSFVSDDVIKIEVTFDSLLGASEIGCTSDINQSFLVK